MDTRLAIRKATGGVWLLCMAYFGSPGALAQPLPAAAPVSVRPKAFGTQDYTITVLSALAFRANLSCGKLRDLATLSFSCCVPACPEAMHYYHALDLPAGAVIDYVGVNTATTVDAAMGVTLHFRDHLGGSAQLASFSLPGHAGFGTDYNDGALGILVPDNHDRVFIVDVEVAPGLESQGFGFVEIWWRRIVSDPPSTPTFLDVPNGHPFYQFVEALGASGITVGCGGGRYCPNAPLTRGEMAVFLSKALGLHWAE